MLTVGLTSVTFRNLDATDVIKYAKASGIGAIEWGSDVHAPVSDRENALKIKAECEKEGVLVSSYGTYYKCGKNEDAKSEFAKYLEIAEAIGAPKMRIWVGEKNFEEADNEYIEKIVSELKMICDMAKEQNVEIGCELHGGTLCNNQKNSLEIIKRTDKDNFGMYFQYDWNFSVEENISTLKSFFPFLTNIHVFNVGVLDGKLIRYSLGENGGEEIWEKFIGVLKENNIKANLLFEFLPDPTCDYLKKETNILKNIINKGA